jgi:hypothetical protein
VAEVAEGWLGSAGWTAVRQDGGNLTKITTGCWVLCCETAIERWKLRLVSQKIKHLECKAGSQNTKNNNEPYKPYKPYLQILQFSNSPKCFRK